MADNNPFQPPSQLSDRLEAMDRELLAWAKLTSKQLLFKLLALGVGERLQLARSLKSRHLTSSLKEKLRKRSGDIEAIAFSFARQGIFIAHGVGKGRPVNSSKANRYKQPWLSLILPPSIQDLANILEEQYADIIATELRFLIPGIIDTKISK